MKIPARRLALAFIMLSTLGGCAVYGPGYPSAYYDTSPYDQPRPVYYAAPVYVGPPVFFNFGYRSGGGFRRHDGGDHGFRGNGGGRGHR